MPSTTTSALSLSTVTDSPFGQAVVVVVIIVGVVGVHVRSKRMPSTTTNPIVFEVETVTAPPAGMLNCPSE
jgi:hypothetical protein